MLGGFEHHASRSYKQPRGLNIMPWELNLQIDFIVLHFIKKNLGSF